MVVRMFYILDGHTPKPATLYEWARWYETANRVVAFDALGDARVSTVFLGIAHLPYQRGVPSLFESMIFGGKLDGKQARYATWDAAEAGHQLFLALVREQQEA